MIKVLGNLYLIVLLVKLLILNKLPKIYKEAKNIIEFKLK